MTDIPPAASTGTQRVIRGAGAMGLRSEAVFMSIIKRAETFP